MNIQEIEYEINQIDKDIYALKIKKEELKKKLMSHGDFAVRFSAWYNYSGFSVHIPHIPTKDSFPKFREYIDKLELNRHQTYHLGDLFESELDYILDPACFDDMDREEFNAMIEKFQPIFKKFMDGNVKSFEFDW